MPAFNVIAAASAPASIAPRHSPYTAELLATVGALTAKDVLCITPDDGQSLRGLKSGIGRILSAAEIPVTMWDDRATIYVRKK